MDEYMHVVDLEDLITSVEAMREGLALCSEDYRRGYTEACDYIISHYKSVLKELQDAESHQIVH